MNETEIAIYEAVLADIKKEKASQAKAEAAQAKAKDVVLAKLGLTADEVTALLS